MQSLTDSQKKIAWIAGVILVLIHFSSGFIRAGVQAIAMHGRRAAPAQARSAPLAAVLAPPQPLPSPVPIPSLPPEVQARFLGTWDGAEINANNDSCKIHLELRASPTQPGYVSAYETRSCFNTPEYLGGKGPKPSFIEAVKDYTPVATVMTGSLIDGDLVFRVDKSIGKSPFQCPLTSYAVSPFGLQAVVAQWRTVGCGPEGQIVLARGRG